MPSNPVTRADLFTCTQCGACCKGFGGTYVNETDIAVIADYLGLSPSLFKNSYCVPSGNRSVLTQRSDGYCIFWDRNCTIHPVKPHMCRTWPFISSLWVDVTNWYIMADACPGMRSDIGDHELMVSLNAKS